MEREFFVERLGFQAGTNNKWSGTQVWYGARKGFEMTAYRTDNIKMFYCIGAYHESPEEAARLLNYFSQLKHLKDLTFVSRYITFHGTFKAVNKNADELQAELDGLLQYLAENGFSTGCFISGEKGPLSLYQVNSKYLLVSETGIRVLQHEEQSYKVEIQNRNENFGLGFLAALGAAIVVGAIIVGAGQIGYRFYYLSVLMPLGIFGAYNFAAKKTSIGSRLFLMIFSIIATFGALYVDWCVTVMRELQFGLKDSVDFVNMTLFNPEPYALENLRNQLIGDAAIPMIIAAGASILGFFMDMKKDDLNIKKIN